MIDAIVDIILDLILEGTMGAAGSRRAALPPVSCQSF